MAKTGAMSILISARELARDVIAEDEFIRRVESWLPSESHISTCNCPECIRKQAQPLQATSGGGVALHAAMKAATSTGVISSISDHVVLYQDPNNPCIVSTEPFQIEPSTGDTPQPQDALREIAIKILSNCAYRYCHPTSCTWGTPQQVIDKQIEIAVEFMASTLPAREAKEK